VRPLLRRAAVLPMEECSLYNATNTGRNANFGNSGNSHCEGLVARRSEAIQLFRFASLRLSVERKLPTARRCRPEISIPMKPGEAFLTRRNASEGWIGLWRRMRFKAPPPPPRIFVQSLQIIGVRGVLLCKVSGISSLRAKSSIQGGYPVGGHFFLMVKPRF
jgi:hypothetical protein